jgi:hypothetical protein
VIGSKPEGFGLRASGFGKVVVCVATLAATVATGEGAALSLRATVNGVTAPNGLTITLERWSTDAERAPVIAALAAPAPPPAPPAGAAAGRAAGRGGRAGGRGAPPASPAVRLSAAIKAAPTLGYIWGDGVTGYSIKYAWRAAERVVLITDRRLGAHAPEWALPAGPAPDAEYTLIELHLDAKGLGEGKTSLSANVVADAAAKTLALDGYAAAAALLRITR